MRDRVSITSSLWITVPHVWSATPEFLHIPVDFRCHPNENTLAAWAAQKWTDVTNLAVFFP